MTRAQLFGILELKFIKANLSAVLERENYAMIDISKDGQYILQRSHTDFKKDWTVSYFDNGCIVLSEVLPNGEIGDTLKSNRNITSIHQEKNIGLDIKFEDGEIWEFSHS